MNIIVALAPAEEGKIKVSVGSRSGPHDAEYVLNAPIEPSQVSNSVGPVIQRIVERAAPTLSEDEETILSLRPDHMRVLKLSVATSLAMLTPDGGRPESDPTLLEDCRLLSELKDLIGD